MLVGDEYSFSTLIAGVHMWIVTEVCRMAMLWSCFFSVQLNQETHVGFPLGFQSTSKAEPNAYAVLYWERLDHLESAWNQLALFLERPFARQEHLDSLRQRVLALRKCLKSSDFWLRYLDPIQYRKLHGVLPVEWEVEVFEKWEAPYRREAGGLFLLLEYLKEPIVREDSMRTLIHKAQPAFSAFRQDSNVFQLSDPAHFYFANRLFLLNLASLYTTGFECPEPHAILPELIDMLHQTRAIYLAYNRSFPEWALPESYLNQYYRLLFFVNSGLADYDHFNHFVWVRDFIRPLFTLNAQIIREKGLISKSLVDFALNNKIDRIYSKELIKAQEIDAMFKRASPAVWKEAQSLGELLFHDPILSGNNERSCASCHKPNQFFTDTATSTALAFDRKGMLTRNAPSLINARYNHLLMLDGQHLSLKDQIRAVHRKVDEMNGDEEETFKELMSCPDYARRLQMVAEQSGNKQLSIEHVFACIIAYYTAFDSATSKFDRAVHDGEILDPNEIKGFNLFMGKAQCATCHFPPLFSGLKPPYSSNEFESLGVPSDTSFVQLSSDRGRFMQHPVAEMDHAFRTSTLRNISHTKPFMHNGVFQDLEVLMEFYNQGGGKGRGLYVPNQTLSDEKLQLTASEKKQIINFLQSLNEDVKIPSGTLNLPKSKNKILNQRVSGGVY